MENHKYSYSWYGNPIRVLFGRGEISKLHEQKIPGTKALIVISDGVTAYVSGGLEKLKRELGLLGMDYVVYDKIHQNPTDAMMDEGARVAKENGCDLVIGLGGGSVLDSAKGIALAACQEKGLWYYTEHFDEIKYEFLPVITITTDAGTGSEVDPFICIANAEKHIKIGFPNTRLLRTFPVLAIVDPELMVTVPKDYSAYQGFDAFFHCAEVYIGKDSGVYSDMYSEIGIKHVGAHLVDAVNDPLNLEAREGMAYANVMGGYVMLSGFVTSEHSIEHAMGAYHLDLPHGAGMLTFCKEYYKTFVDRGDVPERFIQMAKWLGKEDADKPEDFITVLDELMTACGVEAVKMSDYGISYDELPTIVKNAKETNGGGFKIDPSFLTDEDVLGILQRSYK